MKIRLKNRINQINNIDRKWKEENKQYLKELQRFFDSVDAVEDYELKRDITNQMLICDEILTKIAEEMFKDFYDIGYKKAKRG